MNPKLAQRPVAERPAPDDARDRDRTERPRVGGALAVVAHHEQLARGDHPARRRPASVGSGTPSSSAYRYGSSSAAPLTYTSPSRTSTVSPGSPMTRLMYGSVPVGPRRRAAGTRSRRRASTRPSAPTACRRARSRPARTSAASRTSAPGTAGRRTSGRAKKMTQRQGEGLDQLDRASPGAAPTRPPPAVARPAPVRRRGRVRSGPRPRCLSMAARATPGGWTGYGLGAERAGQTPE